MPSLPGPTSPARRRLLGAAGLAALLPALAACDPLLRPAFKTIELETPGYGRDFEMPDIDGRLRRLADYRGQVAMVFFGFTQCPDICPTALARAAEIKQALEPGDAARLAVIFVTIDPQRDTPDILRAYLGAFDPAFVGLRGDESQTRRMADAFNVFYKQVPTGSSYTLDHTAATFVYDPDGRLRLLFRHEAPATDCAADIRLLLHASKI